MTNSVRRTVVALSVSLSLAGVVGCGDDATTAESPATTAASTSPAATPPPTQTGFFAPPGSALDNTGNRLINPARFKETVDNPYHPLKVGAKYRYEGDTDEGREVITVEVLPEKKTILGVKTTVVRDTVTLDGKPHEDTFDWYAQDVDGNVWYFGEATKAIDEDGKVDTEGSWEAGKNGAEAGVIMKANPQVGDKYMLEYQKGLAEDRAEVLALNEKVSVPAGGYESVLKTQDDSPLDPEVVEHKYYAKGVGPVLMLEVKGGDARFELMKVSGL